MGVRKICFDYDAILDELRARCADLTARKPELFDPDYDYAAATLPTKGIWLVSNPINFGAKQPLVFAQLTALMARAREDVTIHSPYAVLNGWMRERLTAIAGSVPVTLMINAVENGANVAASSDYLYHRGEVIATGMHVLEYAGGDSYHGKSIAIDDDVYMYTGVTSVTSDESNIGFILSNQRTKETHFYSIAGAEEYSAMDSAQSQIQQMRYTATFPLLLNIAGQPTYFMALKGGDGLVKMYAFIDVEQYQIVGTGSTIDDAQKNYINALASDAQVDIDDSALAQASEDVPNAKGKIASISPVVSEGNTRYYFMLEDDEHIYIASIGASAKLPFMKAGDEVEFEYTGDGDVCEVSSFV